LRPRGALGSNPHTRLMVRESRGLEEGWCILESKNEHDAAFFHTGDFEI
jgi:hypothetical protein